MASGGPLDGIDITSLGNDPLEAANAAANAVNGVTSLVQDAIRNYYNIISGSSHLGQSGQSMASGGLLDGIVRGAGSLVNNTLGAVGAAVNGATDGVTSLVSNALGTAGTVVNGATNEVASLAQSGIPGVAATVNSVAGAATADATSAVVSLAQNVVSGVDQLA
ncbi:hypothetical protein BDQ17DRAFT_1363649 [Cyathus striatus]|nr:hypothetical protein BDQ17DRAFT_1363649 [Cyathus striatus]